MSKLYIGSGKHYVAKKQEPKKLYIGSTNQDINGAAYLGGKVAAGAASIGIGAWNLIAGTFDQITGNTYAAEKRYAENSARAFSDKLDSMYDANGAMRFAGAVAEGVGQFIPTALISLIPVAGVPLSQGIQFAGYTGMNVEDAYRKTGSLGAKEYVYGAAMGGFETALEFVGGKVGGWLGGTKVGGRLLGVSDNVASAAMKATSGKIGARAATVGARALTGGASEFTEEFIEAYGEVALQRALQIDPNASIKIGEALYAGAVGFAAGASMSGATSVLNTRGAQMTGARIMKAGEADMTVSAAAEIASAFKANGRVESDVVKTLQDNLALWERVSDKTSGDAQMILGNIEVAMNVVSAMSAQQGTVRAVTKNPEKFLAYARSLFGDGVTVADLRDADSRVVRFIAASNWATGEADALAIRAKRTGFTSAIEAEMRGGAEIPPIAKFEGVNGDAVYKSPDGDYIFLSEGKNGLYTVMKGKDLDNLRAFEKDGSAAIEADEVKTALIQMLTKQAPRASAEEQSAARASVQERPAQQEGEKTPKKEAEKKPKESDAKGEKDAAGEKYASESPKGNVLSDKVSRERARLIDEYDAEVQDKARKLLGKRVDGMSADRRIAVYEAILSGKSVEEAVLRAACYFISKRPGLYIRFDRDAAAVDERTAKGGFHKVLFGGKARLVLAANGPKGLRKVLIHEVFHDIAHTKAGEALIRAALEATTLEEAYGTARLYGDFYAKAYEGKGVESFEKFFTDGKYDKESKESVLEAIGAYEKKYASVLPRDAITEELVADTVAERIGNERFFKMAKDTSAAGLVLRGVRRMLSYLKTEKAARPLYTEAVELENLFLDAVQRGEGIWDASVFGVGDAGKARYNLKAVASHRAKLEEMYSKEARVGLADLMARYEKIVEIWKRIGGELDSQFLNEWNEKVGKDRAFTIFKAQSGYKYNAELSSMCKKGVPLFEAIDTIVRREVAKQLESEVISKREKEILYDILKSRGFEIPCAICYVEQARQREGVIIDAFLNGSKKEGEVKLGWNEVLSSVQKEMKRRGVDYTFPSLDRSVATDAYAPVDHAMTEEEQSAFYAVLKKVANEEIRRYNREAGKNRPLVDGLTPAAIKAAFKGTLPSNLKIFKTLFTEPRSRVQIDGDLLYSSETTLNLAVYHNALYALFNAQGGVSGYKTKQRPVVYWGDILSKKWRPKTVRDHGGIRNQSNSDFQAFTLLDQVQMYVDLTAKGYYLQAYTKVLAELKLFGLSGAKINASLIPRVHIFQNADGSIDVDRTRANAGLDENGNPIYDDFEGIPHDEAFMLIEDPQYSRSIGGVCIGYSDKHISALLDDDRVQLVIGYHDKTNDPTKRYRGAVYAKNYNGANEAVNADGKTVHIGFNTFVSEAEGMFKKAKDGGFVGSVTYKGKTYGTNDIPRLATALYLDMCEQKGYSPAYSGTDGGTDFSAHPSYYKLLADFSLYDSEGNYAPHKKVAFSMPDSVPFLDGDGARQEISTEEYIKQELRKELAVRDDIAAALADTSENGIIQEFVRRANEGEEDTGEAFYDSTTRYSLVVTDPSMLEFLEKQDTITTYKTMQLIDGKLYPPMAARTEGQYEDASVLGQWEQATEHPELIRNGKFKLDKGKGQGSIEAAYNPYMHSSNLVLNDQFSGAYRRDNLVTVECEVPVSELASGYRAEFAKDSVGWHPWHTGTVAGQLRHAKGIERKVFLSRWIKPVRILADAEVASMYRELLKGTEVEVPDNVVTPALLRELRKVGVRIKESGRVEESVSDETRLSLSVDSEGAQLTEGQERFFKDSKARDKKGNLLVLYHGTTAKFTTFKKGDVGFHFGTKSAARGRVGYGKSAILKRVYLNITNPIVFKEDLGSWDADYLLTRELYEMGILSKDEAEVVLFTDDKRYKRTTEAANKKLSSLLLSKGYDGITYPNTFETKKATTSFIVFESNQAKEVENAAPTLNPDTRYSLTAAEATVARANRRKVSKGVHEKEKAEVGRGLFYLLKDMRESLKSFVESGYYVAEGIKLHVRAKDLTEVARYLWEKSNTKNQEQMDGAADVVADYLLARMMVEYTDVSEGKKEALAARRILKPYYHNLALSEARKAEIRAALPRASAERFIKVFGAKEGGVDLDGDIADINAQLDGAGLVQYRIHAENDMDALVAFANLYDSVRSLEGERAMATAGEIFNTAEDVESFRAELKKSVLEAMKENGKPGMLRVLTQKKDAAYDRLYERWRETRDKYEGAVKIQYGAAHAVFLAKEIGEMVKTHKYISAADLLTPEMEAVGQILASIATPRKVKDKQAREAMKLLLDWYTPQNLDGDGASENGEAIETSLYHPDIREKMERIAAGDENAQLTYEELRDLAQVLNAIRMVIKNYDAFYIDGRRESATECATTETTMLAKYLGAGKADGNGFIGKMFHNAGEAVGKKLKQNFLYRVMTPRQVVQSLEWYDKNGVLTRAFDEVQRGVAGAGSDYADTMRPVLEFFDSHKKYEKRLTKTFIPYEGEEMSVAQAIALYMTTKREQAAQGFMDSGFCYMGKDGKVRYARPRAAEEIREEISAALSADDKAYVKVLERVFDRARELKVQTDMAYFGYSNVEDGYYFPISRDTMSIAKRVSDLRQTMRDLAVVGNKSFNQNTKKGANNALFIADVTMVTEAHAMGVSQYANLFMPLSSWDRLWTKEVPGANGKNTSVRKIIGNEVWTGRNKRDIADSYFRQLFADIQGVRAEKRDGDGFYAALRSTYVSAALGFNLSSILKQTGSFASAMVYLSPMDLARGLGMNLKTDRAEMWKYSKVANARMFERGRFVSADANTRLESMSRGVKKFGEMTMAGVEGMDNMVVGRLWNACQQSIARTQGLALGTEENKVAAGKLLDTVINETQSSSTQDTRSAFQRGGSLAQTLTMFTSDAVKQVSFLYEGAARLYAARLREKMGTGSKAEVKEAQKFLARSVASFAATTALIVAITQLIKWLLGREREEGETVVEDVANETLGQVLGIFPLVSDIYGKVANNYDVDSFAFEAINGVLDGAVALGSNLHKAANGEAVSRQDILKPIRTVAYELSNFTGIPVRNITNYVVGVTKKVSPELGYGWDALFEAPSYEKDIQKALERGDEGLAQYIMELSLRHRVSAGDYNSPVAAELLYHTENGESVTPSSIPSSVNGVSVNAEQYKKMQRIYGGTGKALAEMIESDAYNALTDEERVDAINTVYRTYLGLAKARVMPTEEDKRTAAVWAAPLLSAQSYAVLGRISGMESTDEASRSEQVTKYLNELDISNDERYLILFAAGYRSKTVLERVKRIVSKSDALSDTEKQAFVKQYLS